MRKAWILDFALWCLLAFGFVGGLNLSYQNYQGTLCPHLGLVPVCYVVTLAYGLMILAIIVRHDGSKHYFFAAGWGTAFVIAFFASVAEFLGGGGVCPTSGGSVRGGSGGSTPLCYLSLGLLIIILALFLIGPYKRASRVQRIWLKRSLEKFNLMRQ